MNKRIIPSIPGYTKIQVVSFLKAKIQTDPVWAIKACLVLFDQQTKKEKRNHLSSGHNQCGFGRTDSPILSHIACKIKQHRQLLDDIEVIMKKLPRYAAQLICIAYEKDKCKKLKEHLDYYYRNNKNSNMPF